MVRVRRTVGMADLGNGGPESFSYSNHGHLSDHSSLPRISWARGVCRPIQKYGKNSKWVILSKNWILVCIVLIQFIAYNCSKCVLFCLRRTCYWWNCVQQWCLQQFWALNPLCISIFGKTCHYHQHTLKSKIYIFCSNVVQFYTAQVVASCGQV